MAQCQTNVVAVLLAHGLQPGLFVVVRLQEDRIAAIYRAAGSNHERVGGEEVRFDCGRHHVASQVTTTDHLFDGVMQCPHVVGKAGSTGRHRSAGNPRKLDASGHPSAEHLGQRDVLRLEASEPKWLPSTSTLKLAPAPALECGRIAESAHQLRPTLGRFDKCPSRNTHRKFTNQTFR
jgi:hypothetical protein